jgi:hypothetical protein
VREASFFDFEMVIKTKVLKTFRTFADRTGLQYFHEIRRQSGFQNLVELRHAFRPNLIGIEKNKVEVLR